MNQIASTENISNVDLAIKIYREHEGELGIAITILEITDTEKLLNNIDNFKNILHTKEIEQLHKLSFPKRKISYLLGRLVAKRALSILDPKIALNKLFINNGIFKQPLIEYQKNFEISISHSANLAVGLAFPKFHPAAIDIEQINTSQIDAIQSCLTAQELKLIYDFSDLNVAYFSLWTTKEALSKAIKCGLNVNFKVLEISKIKQSNKVYIMEFSNFFQYKAISFPYKNYIISFVLPIKSQLDLQQFISFASPV